MNLGVGSRVIICDYRSSMPYDAVFDMKLSVLYDSLMDNYAISAGWVSVRYV